MKGAYFYYNWKKTLTANGKVWRGCMQEENKGNVRNRWPTENIYSWPCAVGAEIVVLMLPFK